MRKALLILAIILAGCTMKGEATPDGLTYICTDSRNGEAFIFDSSTVHNVRIGIGAPSSVDVITIDGRTVTMSQDQGPFFTCSVVDKPAYKLE